MDEKQDVVEVALTSNEEATKNELIHQVNDVSINHVNLLDERQLAAAKVFMTQFMRSKKGGISSVEDGIAILMRAQDLNLPFTACIEHIHVINGKTGVDVHIIKGLLLKAGITFRIIDDYVPLYEYTDSFQTYVEDKLPKNAIKCSSIKEAADKSNENKDNDNIYVYPVRFYRDFNGNVYKEYQLNTKFAVVVNQQQAQQVAQQGKIPIYKIPATPVNYITRYEFTRYFNNYGHTEIVKIQSHYSYLEAVEAGALEKDTYKKYMRIMVGHRAFTYGAREIASDILMGVMETTELKQVNNIEIEEADVVEV